MKKRNRDDSCRWGNVERKKVKIAGKRDIRAEKMQQEKNREVELCEPRGVRKMKKYIAHKNKNKCDEPFHSTPLKKKKQSSLYRDASAFDSRKASEVAFLLLQE